MKNILITLLFAFCCFSVGLSQNFYTNPAIIENSTNKEIIECWQSYLKSKPDSIYDNPYWNAEEKKKFKSFDLLNSEGYLSPSLYKLLDKGYNNEILSIEQKGDTYIIKSMFYFVLPSSSQLYPLAITKVLAKRDDKGEFKLYNWLPYHTRNWGTRKVGKINYIFHPQHPFNEYKAQKANKLLEKIAQTFKIEIDEIDYYIAPSCSEIFKLKGFEECVGMYCTECNNICGSFDTQNNIIYANSIEGEFYAHELMRTINIHFPNMEGVFLNGIAGYVNKEKLGMPIQEHYKSMDKYLEEHKEIDLSDLYSFYQLDNVTAPYYFIGMIICQMCLEKGDIDLLKKGMNIDNRKPDNLYEFIDKSLGVPRKKLNDFMRKQIHKYAKGGMDRIDFMNIDR